MNRRQSIIIIVTAIIVVAFAIWLGIKFFSKSNLTPTGNNNQAVSVEKISYKDKLTMLQDLFAQKLGKTQDSIIVNISREDNTHIKGIVTVKGEYEGVFLAARTSGEWGIVWDGEGKYPCATTQIYNFPGEMVSDCLK
jgi:lipopolysaccharide export LptBFGC system permease protein LptF